MRIIRAAHRATWLYFAVNASQNSHAGNAMIKLSF
jgi:hypothetical protein